MYDLERFRVGMSERCNGMAARFVCMVGVAAACAIGATHAYAADACDAPWMHRGGGFTNVFEPGERSLTYMVTQFSKRDGNNCNGEVHAVMKMAMGGRPMQSESDVHFEIVDGKVAPPAEKHAGSLQSDRGGATFVSMMAGQSTGILSYTGEISGEGQRIAGVRTQGSVSGMAANMGQSVGSMSVPKFVTKTSDKVVGKLEQLRTSAGTIDCWPVAYERSTQAENAELMGHMANLQMKSRVVDHFCPSTGLVMRQDTTINGRSTSMTVSALH